MAIKESLARISSMTTPTNEQTAITQIIVPVLIDLGWDVDKINREHWVGGGKEGGKVDIALMKDNRCVCIVEAKKPGVNLDSHVDQVLRYAFYEGVTFCVLTDGLEWRLYLPREGGRPEEREFAVLRLKDNPIEQSENDLKRFLSREAVLRGDAERDAVRQLKQLQIDRELPDIWRKMLAEPDRELVTWVRNRISEIHSLNPSEDQVAKIIVATAVPGQLTYGSKSANPGVAREVDKRPTGYTLFGDFKPWRSGIGMWIDVVEQVYYRHKYDFLERAKKHLKLTPGSNLILISETPLNEDRDWKQTEIPEIFVYSNLKVIRFKELAHKLLEVFGHPASDLQFHEEGTHHQAASAPSQPTYSSKPTVPGVSKEVDKRPIGYTLFGVRKPWRSGIGMWADVVQEVHSRHEHDFLKRARYLELERSSRFHGKLISDNPQDISRPRNSGVNGIYIERSLTISQCIELAHKLLKLFGHPASDLVIHWD